MSKEILKVIEHEVIVSNPPYFDVVADKILKLESKIEFNYVFINHPGSVIVIPIIKNGKILLVDQYRHTIKQDSIELVAGGCESKDFKREIRREMEEEVGFTTSLKNINRIGYFYPANGYSNEKMEVFVARNLIKTKISQEKTECINKILELGIDDIGKLVKSGKITDGPTLAAMFLFQKYI